jgi:hypothetical protein
MYESFKTACPSCGSDSLVVVGATLVATGERLDMRAPLSADGFEVPTDAKDASTEDEKCHCCACGHDFDLAAVTL